MKGRDHKGLRRKVTSALDDEVTYKARSRALEVMCPAHEIAVSKVPGLADRLKQLKEESIGRLGELVPAAVKSLSENGFRVYVAQEASDAVRYVLGLVEPDCSVIVKSKSNTVKEIGLVRQLESRGISVVETDLGDRIVQLSGVRPGHPLAPAIQVPRERVAELFGFDPAESPEEISVETIVSRARGNLRQMFLQADMGITGANGIAADEGLVVLVENEGNIRALTSLVPVHVVVAGINKIVPSLAEAVTVVRAASAYGAGQDVGTYVSIIGNPGIVRKGVEREVHIVLLDNGRTEAVRHGFGEALNCINCGACLLFCPIYAELGDAYGSEYLGGTGTVLAELLEGPRKGVEAGLDLCLTCRRCIEHCPARIDIPGLILRMRSVIASRDGLPALESLVLKGALGRKTAMRLLVKLARMLHPLLFAESRLQPGVHLRVSVVVPKDRLLPRLEPGYRGNRPSGAPDTRAGRALGPSDRGASATSVRAGPGSGVVLFPGCIAEFGMPNIARASAEVIRRLGYEVHVSPDLGCCGAPAYMKGERRVAVRLASSLVERLRAFTGLPLVTPCPTCASAVKHFYPAILAGTPLEREAASLTNRVFDVTQFVAPLTERLSLQHVSSVSRASAGLPAFRSTVLVPKSTQSVGPDLTSMKTVTYHDPCHLKRWLGVAVEPREILKAIPGVDLREMEGCDECCGFAGLFGIRYYGLSSRIGSRKAKAILDSDVDEVLSACPGCVMQLSDALEKVESPIPVRHVIELVYEHLDSVGISCHFQHSAAPGRSSEVREGYCPHLRDSDLTSGYTEPAKLPGEGAAGPASVGGDLLDECKRQLEAKGCIARVVDLPAGVENVEEVRAITSALIDLINEYGGEARGDDGLLVKASHQLGDDIIRRALELEGAPAPLWEVVGIDRLTWTGSEALNLLNRMSVTLSGFDAAVAETGSIVVGDESSALTVATALPRFHIAVGRSSQIVSTLEDGIDAVMKSRGARSRISVISGPSRTRDIECQLVRGMHGPSMVAVVIIRSSHTER